MLGVIVNTLAIIAGSIIGLSFRRKLPEKIVAVVIEVLGICILFIGIKGALDGEDTIVIIISMVLGTVIGTLIDIEKYVNRFGEFLKTHFAKKSQSSNEKFVEAFVTTSMMFGIGGMAVTGSIEAGIMHEYTIFFTKAILDFTSSIIYSASMGAGVIFSALTIFVLQGSMTILAGSLKFIADNVPLMNDITCVGSLIIIALSLNMLKLTKIKAINMLPAIVLTPVIYFIANFFK